MLYLYFQAAKYKSAVFPVVGAMVGGAIGGPIGLLAGMKVGGLAAVGGGIAGNFSSCLFVFFFVIL